MHEFQIIRCSAGSRRCTHLAYQAMLTEIYIEALLVEERVADQIWETWDVGEIDDLVALRAWWWIVVSGTHKFWCWRTIENQESPYGYA